MFCSPLAWRQVGRQGTIFSATIHIIDLVRSCTISVCPTTGFSAVRHSVCFYRRIIFYFCKSQFIPLVPIVLCSNIICFLPSDHKCYFLQLPWVVPLQLSRTVSISYYGQCPSVMTRVRFVIMSIVPLVIISSVHLVIITKQQQLPRVASFCFNDYKIMNVSNRIFKPKAS